MIYTDEQKTPTDENAFFPLRHGQIGGDSLLGF
jgi:hypothetical protein